MTMPDIFRKQYRQLNDGEKKTLDAIKDKAQELYNVLEQLPNGREVSLAKTNLEQSVMWAVKAVTG
jgi:hypothetical protein